jgi:hypothetical protein
MLCLLAALIFSAGCKFFQKEEAPPEPEETPVVEEKATEEKATEEASEEKKVASEKEAEEEGPETLVSKEDIEKAAKIYNMLHDEELKDKAKEEKFAAFLKEFDWDLETYEQMVYDIGRDPASTAIYKELQETDE